MSSIITCSHVDLGYDGHVIVKNLNMDIERGSYISVIGQNGSGKSTFIKTLLGLVRPVSGKIHKNLPANGIGYLPQQTEMQKNFPATAMEVVLSGFLSQKKYRPFYTKKERFTALGQLKKLGILNLSKTCYRELSGGQQQRVLLARALCASGHLLVLDEPVTGLDPAAAKELYRLLKKLNEEDGMAVLMVSHDLSNALKDADHILHIGHEDYFFGTKESYRRSEYYQKINGGAVHGIN